MKKKAKAANPSVTMILVRLFAMREAAHEFSLGRMLYGINPFETPFTIFDEQTDYVMEKTRLTLLDGGEEEVSPEVCASALLSDLSLFDLASLD